MLITNHTRFCIAVNANEFVGFISPESSLEVPADVAETWLQPRGSQSPRTHHAHQRRGHGRRV